MEVRHENPWSMITGCAETRWHSKFKSFAWYGWGFGDCHDGGDADDDDDDDDDDHDDDDDDDDDDGRGEIGMEM